MTAVFDPTVFLENLAWLKPEVLLTILGFVLLGLAVVLPRENRWAAGLIALLGLIVTAVLVVSYLPGVPFGDPKITVGDSVGAFNDAAGQAAFVGDGLALVFKLKLAHAPHQCLNIG